MCEPSWGLPGAFTGVSWDQLPCRGAGQVCTWAWRGPCPPKQGWRAAGGEAAPSGRWRDPRPPTRTPSLHVHSFLNLPGVSPLSWASSPGLTSSH